MGYRGRPIGFADVRIAAFGGSTTESLYVPEERSWPRIVEVDLARELGSSVWVGNFGKSGRNSRQHILDAKYVLPQFSAHVALFLVGANDLGLFVRSPQTWPISLEQIQSDTYLRQSLVVNEVEVSPIKLLGLVRAARDSIAARLSPVEEAQQELPHISTEFYRRNRALRASRAGFLTEMPDLEPWLDEYTRNLTVIADLVASNGALPVFISQPALWSANVSPDVDALLWWGRAGGGAATEGEGMYYSPQVLERMLTAYNDRLRKMAEHRNIPLINAATRLPKTPAYFYDDWHYNEAGSRALAEIVTRDLVTILNGRKRF
jgi:lysophospholipase L1-like esterase